MKYAVIKDTMKVVSIKEVDIDKINFSGALFCRTIMPSGKKNNKDC
jgi:hypothetical protein